MRVRFAGTRSSSLTCRPAPSSTSAACVPAGTARASSARSPPIAPPGAHGPQQGGGGEAPLARPARARPFLVPDAGDAALLADPRLVHEPRLDPSPGVVARDRVDQLWQVFSRPAKLAGR